MTHPPIDFAKLPPVDLERFERALEYRPVPMGKSGQYVVYYAPEPLRQEHHVDLESSDVPRCDCGDFLYRESLCKHILACLIAIKHPVAQQAIVDWLAQKRK